VVGEGFGRSGVCVIRGTRNYLTGRSGKYFYNMKMSSYWDDRLEDYGRAVGGGVELTQGHH
jgi:hypothetical protein